jgi:hypothetical protein
MEIKRISTTARYCSCPLWIFILGLIAETITTTGVMMFLCLFVNPVAAIIARIQKRDVKIVL